MKVFWKIFTSTLLIVAMNMLAPWQAASAQTDQISVAYCQDCVPFHFTDEDGQPAGLIIDQWRLWSEKTKIKIDFKVASWSETLRMVGAGEADAHAGLFFNAKRDEYLDYGAGLGKTDTHFFVHRDLPPVENIEDLGAYRVGVIEGDFVEGFLKQRIPESSVIGFQSYQDIMDALQAGRLSAFAVDTLTGLHYLQKSKLNAEFEFPSSKPLYQNEWFAAVGQGNAQLLKIINDGMGLITSDERSSIGHRWASSSVESDENVLVISVPGNYPPFAIAGFKGEPRGLLVELWQLWSETTGNPIRFLPSGWTGTLDSVKSGAADIHFGLFKNDERSTWLDFSDPIHEIKTGVYFLSNSPNAQKISEFYNERVGAISGTHQELFLKDQYGDINLKGFDSGAELVSALLNGDVDFIVNETPTTDATINRLGLQRDISRGFDELLSNFIHAGIAKGNEALLKKINDGFAAIDFDKAAAIDEFWMANLDHRFYRKVTESVKLTREEEDWLAVHPFIRLAVTSFINPVDIVDAEGNYSGMNADLMTLLNKKLGTRIVPEIFNKWSDVAENTLSGDVDGAFSFSRTPAREKHVYFTKPYAYDPVVVIARQGDKNVKSWNDLAGKTVSVAKGFAIVDELRQKVGDGDLKLIDSDEEGLKLLSEGITDAHVTFQLPYTNARKNVRVNGLRIVDAKNDEAGAFRIAVHKSRPILFSIIQKGVNALTRGELSELQNRWLTPDQAKPSEVQALDLSKAEQTWLDAHRTVRVMVGTWPPFHFMDGMEPRGLALDYVRHILKKVDLEIEYVPISFKDALDGISKLESVDLLPTIARSEERENLVAITDDYLSFPRVIFARNNNAFGSLDELHGKTVAVERGFITASLLKKDHPEINLLEVDTTKDALEAVSFSKADAFVSNMAVGSYLIDNLGLTNLSVSGQTDYKSDIQAMGVRKDWPELASIIDKSLAAMSATQARDIRQPWITLDISALRQTKRAELSAEERQWLQNHPVIRVGNETDWPPFDFAKNGTAKGMSIDIMDAVAKKVGTRVEYTNGYSWVELMAMFKAGELDVLPAIYQSEDRLKYMVFTDSYATNPSVLAIHRKNSALNSLDKLAGKKVGIVAGFVSEELLAKTYPDVNVVSIKNIEDGLFKVSAGEIDATFGSLGVISNLIETKFIPNISISFNTGLNVDATTELRMAALQENVILRDILQKGLDAISPEEMRAIRSKWMSVEAMSGDDAAKAQPPEIVRTQSSRGLWLTVGAAVLIFIGLIAFIKILLRSSKGDAVALQMGSKRFRFMIIGTVLLLALLVCSVSWLTFNHNKNRIIEANGVNLQTVLNNTVERVLIWIEEGKSQIAHSGRDPQLVTLTMALLALPQDKESLQFSKALSDIRRHIRDQDKTIGSQGFFIITPGGISIGSMRDENLASKNLIAIQKPDLFKQVAGGTAVFIPPIRSDVHLEAGANGPALPPTMFFAAPIVDEDGTVLAVLTNRVAPGSAFTRGVQTGYIGESGETYAFDASGLMMSSSRFEDDLMERGVLEKGQSSILNIVLSPPSANDPTQLTFMAQSAVSGRSGINLDGYEDYRGVKTIGTWVWLDQLGLGLATEIDATEVFEIIDTLKRTILIVLGLTLTLSMGATLFTLSLGERTSASLIRAKEELEGRVLERTKEVQRQRDLITAVMDSMTVGVAAFDEDLKLIAWNQKYLDIRGYPDELVFDGASFEDLIRHDIENDEFGPGDPEQIFAEKMNHAHKFESHAFDRKRPNGTFIEVLGGPIEGGGFVSTYADITERKQTERALNMAVDENKRQTARFRNLTNNLPAMVFQFMALGPEQIHITYASPFMSDTFEFGDTGEDEITELFYDRLHPDDDNRVRTVFAEIIANKGFLNETFRIQKTDGQVRWLEAAARSYEVTDGFMQWDGLILDITERKQAEQKLQAAEEHTRLILESAGEGVFGLDTQGVMTFVNPSACRMLGFSSEDIIGQAMHALIHHTYADGSPYPAEQCYMRKAFMDGEVHHVADEVLWRHDGTSFPVEYASTPIRKDGELLGAVVTFSDVTKRKQAEEEILEARDKAEAATKSKAAFLAAMSHEIRTPMNGVVGMISLLQETQLESDQRTMMNTVQDSAFSLLQIINDILDFSKIEAGKLTLEKIPVNIDTVMEGVSETLLPNVAKKNLRMSLFIDPDIPEHVLTDQVRLRQILFNLAGNATKFTENTPERQGVVTLRAELTEPVREGRTHIRFSVMDNGIGMKPEAVEKLFTPFTQADQSTTRRFGGTGLGLSICKTLADLMGGVINVESTEGEGSAFHVTLPFDIAEQADDHIRTFDLSGLNIAYAVKYDDTAEAVERYAIANGARVTRFPAADIVANATALAISDPLDIIILGTLEDGQGREAIIETLRDDANVPGPRFVLLSDDRAEGRGMVLPDKVVVACAPVRKTGFLHGVAMAAGRASPEIENTAPKLGADARKAPTIEEARVAGELILVAEDNVTNQDVIRRQLNVLGYACEVADDGMIALEMLKGCPYGMLLTDCHMPNMDGYELTGALRNLELDADKRLPVVAITANALQGEAERCLASGMDDYLAKPLEMNKLKAMLGKWLPVDHGDAADAPTPVAEATPAADTSTDAVVNVKALTDMFGDDQEMLKEILGDYIEPSSNIIGEIDAGYEAHDAEAIGKAGHKLKSSSRAIGADVLADLCAALEKAGKGGDWDEIEKLHPDLRSTFDAVISFIENL